MKVVFCVYGYSPEVERLQPWLTVHEVAAVLIASGWEVCVVTDLDEDATLDGLQTHHVKSLRPSNSSEVSDLLRNLQPDRVVALSTPMNLSSASWYKTVECDLYAFLSYPFYTHAELFRALPHIDRYDVLTYGRHALVPKVIWAATLRRYFHGVIGQSQKTVARVAAAVGGKAGRHIIRAGTDTRFWSPYVNTSARDYGHIRFLFIGSPKAIRGFRLLVEAFDKLDNDKAELRILARGASDVELFAINNQLGRYCVNSKSRVTIEGGWLDREDLRDEIRAASVVVLPFVLVPSELPVSVLECVACGTPVISTDIDGLPEAVGKAGLIVRSGNVRELISAMNTLASDPEMLARLEQHCLNERESMQSWEAMGEAWLQLLTR